MIEVLVDANVLLRHLTGRPPSLARRAAGIMRAAEDGEIGLVVTPLTLAECVWVLETSYGKPREVIADALLTLLQAPGIAAREKDALIAALNYYRQNSRLDFADAYLAGIATTSGPPHVASFDRELRKVQGIRVLSDQTP